MNVAYYPREYLIEIAASEGIDLTGCTISGITVSDLMGRDQVVQYLRMLAAIPDDDGMNRIIG